MVKNNDIKKELARFDTLWTESVHGNYKNVQELGNLARQIRDAKCNDEFLISTLSDNELILYRYAVILANTK